MKFKSIFLIGLFFITINVFAINDCTNSEMKRLNELANNVVFKYDSTIEYYDNIYEVIYKIETLNTNSDLHIYYNITGNDKDNKIIDNIKNENLYEGLNVYFSIYSYTNNLCTDELLKRKTLKLPVYNYYYLLHEDKCMEYKDFKYCQKYLDASNLTEEEIDELFLKYLNSNENSSNSKKKLNNYWYMIGGGILLIIVIVVVIIKKRKKEKENDI